MNVNRTIPRRILPLMLLMVVIFDLYVLVFLLTNASSKELTSAGQVTPEGFTFDNFKAAWSQARLGQLLMNSGICVAAAAVIVALVSIVGAFAISRVVRSPATQRTLRGGVLVMLAVPPSILVTPIFYVANYLELIDSYLGLVLVYSSLMLPFGLYVMERYISDLPREIYEAAMIDGAGTFVQLRSITVPYVWPAIVTVLTLSALTLWNDLLFGLLIMQTPDQRPVTVGVSLLQSGLVGERADQVVAAAMLISILPPLVFLIAGNRRVAAGLTAGAVK